MNSKLLLQAIENFRQHLLNSFDSFNSAYELYKVEANSRKDEFTEDFIDYFGDWAQSNWELLVERVVCSNNESLMIYGSGSDYECGAHSRVFYHSIKPTHQIVCLAKSSAIDIFTGNEIDLSKYEFDSFVSTNGSTYDISPPFNHIYLTEKGALGGDYKIAVVPIEQITLQAQEIES